MQEAANNLEFELAADIRDRIRELREEYDELVGPDDEGVPVESDPEF
jgi:excinuclease ABC subunit B